MSGFTHEGNITLISDLDEIYPKGTTDYLYGGDNELRQIKAVLKGTLPNITGIVTSSHTELNFMDGFTGAAIPASWTYFGTAAGKNVGTAANNVVQLDGSAKLPAVSADNLTGSPALSAVNMTHIPINEHFNSLTSMVTVSSANLNALAGVTSFGTAHSKNFGTAIGNLVEVQNVGGTPGMPAVDGSNLTNLQTTNTLVSEININATKNGFFLNYWFGTQ